MNVNVIEQNMPDPLEINPIGVVHSCYTEKFGIPRQPGLVDKARATIELFSPYNRAEMVRKLESFSHIWVHFLFHDAVAEGWRPTVRPPGLGGQKRVGVFASRSPHRPNHLGISAVKLIGIKRVGQRLLLEVGGGDFLHGSPVFDLKPYIPYSDSISTATTGYTRSAAVSKLRVSFSKEAQTFCRAYNMETGRDLLGLIEQVLEQDPRPASQHRTKTSFGFRLWDVNIRWIVGPDGFTVVECGRVENVLQT